MPERDLHKKAFDAGTLAKLELFKFTAQGFLSVFIKSRQNYKKNVSVYDFFCGPGLDKDGNEGSSVQLLRQLHALRGEIAECGYSVEVFLNDADGDKVDELEANLKALGLDRGPYIIRYGRSEFLALFAPEVARMKKRGSANLVLVDQNGVKQFPPHVFSELRGMVKTDFMVFMSSSYAWRLQDAPEMQKHLATQEAFGEGVSFYNTHRAMVGYYRSLIPANERYYLAPFSIKKGSNIYGVMFGSSNPRGMEKFLDAAWRIDPLRGEANFDIDVEGRFNLPGELGLEWGKLTKERLFQKELREAVLSRALRTNAEVYIYSLEHGFLPKHANEVLSDLRQGGLVERVTGVRYESLAKPQPLMLVG